MGQNKRSIRVWFVVLFVSFTILILAVVGVATYMNQLSEFNEDAENNIRHVGEYLAELIKVEGQDFAKYQEYYMNHYKEMRIEYGFSDCEKARVDFIKLFSERYPGKALGTDIPIENTSPDVQRAYYTYKHEYWLLIFEKARKTFDLPYTYYLVMGDPRARIDELENQSDPAHTVCYMIDGERTLDKNLKEETGRDFLFLGDTYFNDRDTYQNMWDTWDTGVKQSGFIEWDNDWGHTYGCYTPLIVNGNKLGLVVTEIDVSKVMQSIAVKTMELLAIIGAIFIVGLFVMLFIIRKRFILRTERLEKAMETYSLTKDTKIADEIEREFSGKDEIDILGRGFVAMVREVGTHIEKTLKASHMLTISRRRENTMSEIASRDELTGIRNKEAFDREISKIGHELRKGEKEFGIALVDMNDLKQINESYGHGKGDIAIQKLSKAVCLVFAHSPVFRVGGDEFAVILKNDDYQQVSSLVDEYYARLKSMDVEDINPWEKVSGALGYALYDEEKDFGSVDSVFRRAEENMTENKKVMKASDEG